MFGKGSLSGIMSGAARFFVWGAKKLFQKDFGAKNMSKMDW